MRRLPPAVGRGLATAIVLLLGAAASVRAQPANDTCNMATVIGELPFHESVDLATATEDGDHWFPCQAFNSVWYEITSEAAQTIRFRPEGSTIAGVVSYDGACERDRALNCSALSVSPGFDLPYRACAGQKYVF